MSKSPISRTKGNKSNLDDTVVKCPICSDRFTSPKSLPCLHTFCEKCLGTYIERYTQDNDNPRPNSFPCPQCRAIAIPIDSTAAPGMWAEQLPTNGFIMNVMEIMSFENKEKTCEPCQKQNKESVRADVWCKHCRICLCKTCINYHNALFLDHETMPVDQALRQPSILTEDEIRCSRHNQSMELFCLDHNTLVCSVCVALEHRRCVQVLTTEFYAKELKNTREVEKLVEQFNECLSSLEEIVNENIKQHQNLNNKKDDIKKKMKTFRGLITGHLDKLEESFNQRLTKVHKEEKDKIQSRIQECKVTQSAVEHSRKMIQATASYGSNAQFVATVAKARENYLDFKQKAMENSAKLESIDIKFRFNPKARDIPATIMELGEVKISHGRPEAPKPIAEMKPMIDKRAVLIRDFHIRLPSDSNDCVVTGGIYLPDGKVILCDFHNKTVKMFKDTGIFISKVLLTSEPFDICQVDMNTLVCTLPNNREIALLNMTDESLLLQNTVFVGKVCYGVDEIRGNLVLLFPLDKPVPSMSVIEVDGHVLDTVHRRSSGKAMFENRPFHLAINQRTAEIVVTQKTVGIGENRAIVLYSDLNVRLSIEHDSIRWARGVSIDGQDNIYICGQNSSNVMKLSSDGSDARVLLDATDGLEHPAAIHICGDRFFLSDVGYTNRNVIKIYEMV